MTCLTEPVLFIAREETRPRKYAADVDNRNNHWWAVVIADRKPVCSADGLLPAIDRLVQPDRTMLVLNKENGLSGAPPAASLETFTLVQPENRGTAPAVLYSLLSIARRDPTAIVALFLASRSGMTDAVFMRSVCRAFRLVEQSPGLLILPGVIPHFAATSCEWIEPRAGGSSVLHDSLLRVERIWKKPALYVAERLLASGCLWNSSVLVASVPALISLVRVVAPEIYRCFERAAPAMGTADEADAVGSAYARLPFLDFGSVLAVIPEILNVLPVLHTIEFLGQTSPGKGETK